MKFEAWCQWKMRRFLDGPATFRVAALEPHRAYRSSSIALFCWVFGFLRLFLTAEAFWLAPAWLLTAGYASLAMNSVMRLLLPVTLAILAVDFTAGWICRPKVTLERELPDRVRAGSVFRVRFRLRNRRKHLATPPLWCDPFPYAAAIRPVHPAATGEIPPGGSAVCVAECAALRRGVFSIYPARTEARFPFHLVKWSVRARNSARKLIVHPAFPRLEHVVLPPGARSRRQAHGGFSRVGDAADPSGLRDYRDGDDVRHIDWPGSARSGEFIVKEFEENELRRIALMIDTDPVPPRRPLFRRAAGEQRELEAAIALAASLAEYFSRDEAVVDLFVAGAEIHRFETGRARGSFTEFCDILSGIEPSPEGEPSSLDRLSPEVFADLRHTGAATVILLGDDARRRAFVERLRAAGVGCRVFLVAAVPPPELPPEWDVVTPETILESTTLRF